MVDQELDAINGDQLVLPLCEVCHTNDQTHKATFDTVSFNLCCNCWRRLKKEDICRHTKTGYQPPPQS
jgi:hypothetical protein